MYKLAPDLKLAFCTDTRFTVCRTGGERVLLLSIYQGSCARL